MPPLPRHVDWPPLGTRIQRMSEIDLPHKSSGTDRWYYNFHLSLVDGRKASAFIAFFRTTSLKPSSSPISSTKEDHAEHELCYTHLLNFALSILPPENPSHSSSNEPHSETLSDASKGQYFFTSAMDADNAALMCSMLEVETRMDPLIQRSFLEVMRDGKLLEPDVFIPGDIAVSEQGFLDLKYGDLANVVCNTDSSGKDVYHIVARAEDGSYAFELDLTPQKPPINCLANGIVQGDLIAADDGMYSYFIPHCEVTGSVLLDDATTEVDSSNSMGWYYREFGGGIREWYSVNASSTESSWTWASAQLSNGWNLTIYTLRDVDIYHGESTIRDKKVIFISPEGTRIECDEYTFDSTESWTSMLTLNEYGTKWVLDAPQLDIHISMKAPFVKQEFRTVCVGRGYWEGGVSIAGTIRGETVNGFGFVKDVPPQFITKFEKFLKRIGDLSAVEVSRIYPDHLIDAEHAMNILAIQSQHDISTNPGCLPPLRFTQDICLDTLYKHYFAPVRHLTDCRGKSWRCFVSIACIAVFGVNPESFTPVFAAAELLHTGSLIIDDIQDQSPLRRGVNSVHSIWGIATAINSGTAAYFPFDTAIHRMSRHLRPEQIIRLYEIYFETMRGGHVGQALDIAGQQQSDLDDILAGRVHPSILEKRVLSVHRLKTALVAANLAKMSAVIANASPAQINALSTHLEHVGIAFQIIDDVYDIRGRSHTIDKERMEEQVLKRCGDDIRSGKITFPIAKAGTMMPLDEAQWVWETVLSKPSDDDVTVHKVIDKLEVYGVVDLCVKEAHKMVDDSWVHLDPHLKDTPFKMYLRALGWYLVKYTNA